MSDFKEEANNLLLVLLSIAVLMLFVYFQQSREWNRTLKSRDQKINTLNQKIAEDEQALAKARDTIAGQEAASKNTADDLKSAREIIGALEQGKQKSQKEIAELKNALRKKNNEAAKFNSRLSAMMAGSGKELVAKDGRITELESETAVQTRQLSEAKDRIQRLEESEQALQNKLQTADQAYADLDKSHQSLLDEFTALKKAN
jgi:chromosome segregation ATPase